jgi:hypothetical protein
VPISSSHSQEDPLIEGIPSGICVVLAAGCLSMNLMCSIGCGMLEYESDPCFLSPHALEAMTAGKFQYKGSAGTKALVSTFPRCV